MNSIKIQTDKKIDRIESALVNLTERLSSSQVNKKKFESSETPGINTSSPAFQKTATYADIVTKSSLSKSASPEQPQVKSQVCIIGDPISANVDQKIIANVMKAEVRTARAYSSVKDTDENEAKEKTKFPDKSFENVINEEASNTETDILIIQSGSVDITNLKTSIIIIIIIIIFISEPKIQKVNITYKKIKTHQPLTINKICIWFRD